MPHSQPELPETLRKIQETLWNARVTGKPCGPLTESHPELTLADAYRISRELARRRAATPGSQLVGRKIGLTSSAVQKQLGVTQPDFGYLSQDMLLPNQGVLPAGTLIQGRAEGEVAFILKAPLQGPGLGPSDVAAATESIVACIEIIDSRVKDWKIRIQDTIADNASSSHFVLGEKRFRVDGMDLESLSQKLRMMGMTLRRNGEIEATGVGAACLDNPLNAVAWLANAVAEFGERLEAGDIILSGAFGPVVPFQPGDRVAVEFSGLGAVSASYASPLAKNTEES